MESPKRRKGWLYNSLLIILASQLSFFPNIIRANSFKETTHNVASQYIFEFVELLFDVAPKYMSYGRAIHSGGPHERIVSDVISIPISLKDIPREILYPKREEGPLVESGFQSKLPNFRKCLAIQNGIPEVIRNPIEEALTGYLEARVQEVMKADGYVSMRDVASVRRMVQQAYLALGLYKDSSPEELYSLWTYMCRPFYGNLEVNIIESTLHFLHVDHEQHATLVGSFDRIDFESLERKIKSRNVHTIELGSIGGSITSAMQLGKLIRKHKLNTTLVGDCESACAIAFLGGRYRWGDTSKHSLRFHQIHFNGISVPTTHSIYSDICRYAFDLSVNGDFIVAAMLKSSPSSFYSPSKCELLIAHVLGDLTPKQLWPYDREMRSCLGSLRHEDALRNLIESMEE